MIFAYTGDRVIEWKTNVFQRLQRRKRFFSDAQIFHMPRRRRRSTLELAGFPSHANGKHEFHVGNRNSYNTVITMNLKRVYLLRVYFIFCWIQIGFSWKGNWNSEQPPPGRGIKNMKDSFSIRYVCGFLHSPSLSLCCSSTDHLEQTVYIYITSYIITDKENVSKRTIRSRPLKLYDKISLSLSLSLSFSLVLPHASTAEFNL